MLTDLDEQKQYLYRAAQLYEEVLDQPLRAIEVYMQVLELDAEDLRALDKLIELLPQARALGRPARGLRQARPTSSLRPRRRRRSTGRGGRGLRARAARQRARHRHLPAHARARSRRPQPRSRGSTCCTSRPRTGTSCSACSSARPSSPATRTRRSRFRYRIAELFDQRLNDSTRAVEVYREILELAPDHEPTLQRARGDDRGQARAAGRRRGARARVPPARRVAEARQRARSADRVRAGPGAQGRAAAPLAELCETQLENPRAAFEAYGRASRSSRRTRTRRPRSSGWRSSSAAGPRSPASTTKPCSSSRRARDGSHVDLALRSAQIYEVSLENIDAAIERYRIVLDADPAHAEALESLDRLYEHTGRNERAGRDPAQGGRGRAHARRHAAAAVPARSGAADAARAASATRSRSTARSSPRRPSISRPCTRSRRCSPTGSCRWRSATCSSRCTACRARGTR